MADKDEPVTAVDGAQQSPLLRKRDIIPPLCGATLLLLIDGYLLVPGIGLLLASLMILASLFALLGKLYRGRGGKLKAGFKLFAYAVCLAGIYSLNAVHRADAKRNANPIIAAVGQYQRDHGRHPEKVDDLVPRYLAEIPRASWRLNAGRYHLDVNPETGVLELWWPAHLRVAMTYDFRDGTWRDVTWD